MNHKLTDRKYWGNYYNQAYSNKEQIETICSVYDDLWDKFIKHKKNGEVVTIIEIGAFPGRYISYISKKYGLIPSALDYNKNTEQIKNSFNAMGLNKFSLIRDDFLKLKFNKKYNYVYSIGFIEHFINFREIMDNHLKLLENKGRLPTTSPVFTPSGIISLAFFTNRLNGIMLGIGSFNPRFTLPFNKAIM